MIGDYDHTHFVRADLAESCPRVCIPRAYVFVSIRQALGEYKVPPLRGVTYPPVCLFYFGWSVWGRCTADRDLNSHSQACTRTLVIGHPARTPRYFLKPSFTDSARLTRGQQSPAFASPARALQVYASSPSFLHSCWGSNLRSSCLWHKHFTN